MLLHPLVQRLVCPTRPRPKVLDLKTDTANATTYTFSGMNLSLGGVGVGYHGVATAAENPGGRDIPSGIHRATSRSAILSVIHSEDALATFDVSTVTLGGVSGLQAHDRGGVTSAINTAIFYWDSIALQGISNTDLVVTHSEAVTSCAAALIRVDGVKTMVHMGSGDNVGTGAIQLGISQNQSFMEGPYSWGIIASTLLTDSSTEALSWSLSSSFASGAFSYNNIGVCEHLYEGSHAEAAYAGLFFYIPQYIYTDGNASDQVIGCDISWSGAGAGDAIGVMFN